MKKQVVFIHGGDAFTKHEDFLEYLRNIPIRNLPPAPGEVSLGHWTMTLREDLGSDFEVFMPSMPNKQNAQYEEWKIWFERHFEYLHDGVVLVGWSLGGMFLAKYLSEHELPVTVSALYLLAAPCGSYEDTSGNDCGSFVFSVKNLQNIAKNIKNIEIWHSEDDFVVPFTHVQAFKAHLPEAKLVTFTDKNHFLTPAFPELLLSVQRSLLQ